MLMPLSDLLGQLIYCTFILGLSLCVTLIDWSTIGTDVNRLINQLNLSDVFFIEHVPKLIYRPLN